MNADGSNQSKLISNSDYSFHHFTFSPDGKKIAFVSTGLSGWKEDIYVINIDGSGLMQLTTNPERDTHPAWSPDGTKIAFQSNREGGFAIYIMNADGSNQTKLSKYDGTSPAWSPDGKKIAFSASDERYGISGFSRVILVMDADGSNVIVITHGLDDENPAWSPDGTKIAFQSVYSYQNGYAWEICVVNAD
ncbi:MAG: hypothetical protein QMD80_09625, partial [archaeon]|nr:hypothetical protein [archaeon]